MTRPRPGNATVKRLSPPEVSRQTGDSEGSSEAAAPPGKRARTAAAGRKRGKGDAAHREASRGKGSDGDTDPGGDGSLLPLGGAVPPIALSGSMVGPLLGEVVVGPISKAPVVVENPGVVSGVSRQSGASGGQLATQAIHDRERKLGKGVIPSVKRARAKARRSVYNRMRVMEDIVDNPLAADAARIAAYAQLVKIGVPQAHEQAGRSGGGLHVNVLAAPGSVVKISRSE